MTNCDDHPRPRRTELGIGGETVTDPRDAEDALDDLFGTSWLDVEEIGDGEWWVTLPVDVVERFRVGDHLHLETEEYTITVDLKE